MIVSIDLIRSSVFVVAEIVYMARPSKYLGAFTMLTSKIVRVEFHHTLHAMNFIDSIVTKCSGTAGYLELLGNCRVFTPFVSKYKEANPNNIKLVRNRSFRRLLA